MYTSGTSDHFFAPNERHTMSYDSGYVHDF